MRVETDESGGAVWRIRLGPDEPEGDVVFSEEGFDDLAAALAAAQRTADCRMVVLLGQPGTFCRGMNLDALVADPEHHAHKGTAQYAACLRALRGSSKVVVSLVDGVATAGGVGLALAGDWVFATKRSSFGLPEPIVGMVPAMVLPLLLERMPAQRVRRFVLGGTSVSAEQAAELGMVDQVVEDEAGLEWALKSVAKQVLRLEPTAVARLKRVIGRMASAAWDAAVSDGRQTTQEMLLEPERVQNIAAFLRGEPLPWFERYRRPEGDS
ncbi:MAG: enoyl-CoA hydratase/isomerase family protein [Deltaproteobacteria bacterium]|jgi:methylglutaconyl-CoA hydratase/polyketide biosynthesis enoyl-CoA hydratase PksH|nr:enoyl-CoA hydratase/isomerase family protein [Deltaproteobacteria bacterium]MBW2536576.1 enoyl-CoA hydratase/isomerase family protein [Deltaproteobacteria bacterium]